MAVTMVMEGSGLLAHVWLQFDAYWFLVLFLFLIIVHFLEAWPAMLKLKNHYCHSCFQ